MKKFRLALSALAILMASVAAYSFTSAPREIPGAASDTDYWIKYDCKASPAVTIVTTGLNYTTSPDVTQTPGYNANCGGNLSYCAKRFAAADVEDVPGHPGNKQPKAGATVISSVKCNALVP